MNRIALVLAFLAPLTGCVLDEATPEDLAEVESEATTIGPTITALVPGQAVTISGVANSIRYFKLDVPADHDHVIASRDGVLSVGADIYMKRGSLPTTTSYDCRRLNGASGQCTVDYPAAGTYYIMVLGRDGWTNGYTNMRLTAYARNTYEPIDNAAQVRIYNPGGYSRFFKLAVPAGAASVSFTFTLDAGDRGKHDLVVKHGAFATSTVYNCKQEIDYFHNRITGTCTFTSPPAGIYYVGLLGHYRAVFGTFTARYRMPVTQPALDVVF
jgi:hypothetical protein